MNSNPRPSALSHNPLLLLFLFTLQTLPADFHLPDGFSISPAADQPRVRFPMFATFDHQRRLYVAESSGLDLYSELQNLTRRCRISLLEDTDRDGIFDSSHIFAEKLVFPMGLAWREGKLYVADPPDLITLEDTDGDNRADKRAVLLTGFGHTDNGSLHGLTFGPDGWLYMTMGQPDGFRIRRSDGKIVEGKSGALLRCKPDGSELEVVCRGFENLVEIVFMPTGEIIGTDNWFSLPQDGVRDALVHLVPGGVYPLNAHARTERDSFFSGELLPALQTYPAVALSGLMRHTGRGVPIGYRDSLFSAQFNTRKIVRHNLSRHSSTFQSTDEDFLTTDDPDFHPSDLLEDADGSIIVVDTGSWYVHHCPTGRIRKTPAEGRLYRIRYPGRTTAPAVPVGRSPSDRRNIQLDPPPPTGNNSSGRQVDLSSPADEIAASLRTLARTDIPSQITNSLSHRAAHVRLAAAEVIAARKTPGVFSSLTSALANETDPLVIHALIYALHQTADTPALESLLKDPRPPVRGAALILLDQAPHRKLQPFDAIAALNSENAALRNAGLAAFQRHPEWHEHALAIVKQMLAATNTSEGLPAVREFIGPFAESEEIGRLITLTAADTSRPTALRAALLEILASRPANREDADVVAAFRSALHSIDPDLIRTALRAAPVQHLPRLEDDLTRIAHSQYDLALRLDAARALVRFRPALTEQTLSLLESALAMTNSPALRLAAAEILSTAALSTTQLERFIQSASRDRIISPSLVVSAAQRAISPAPEPLLDYLLNALDSGWQLPEATLAWLDKGFPKHSKLERLRATARQTIEDRLAKLASYEPLLEGGDPNAGHQLFLGKLACATCHRVGKHGGLVGPDLTRIGAIRSGRDLIESLVYPSATIAQGYDSYLVTLADGETLTGVRVRQHDDAFVLRDSSGAETRLHPSQFSRAERRETSLMPDGLVAALEAQEIRDLLAYLQSLE